MHGALSVFWKHYGSCVVELVQMFMKSPGNSSNFDIKFLRHDLGRCLCAVFQYFTACITFFLLNFYRCYINPNITPVTKLLIIIHSFFFSFHIFRWFRSFKWFIRKSHQNELIIAIIRSWIFEKQNFSKKKASVIEEHANEKASTSYREGILS